MPAKPKRRKRTELSYDASATTNNNQENWKYVDNLSPNEENNLDVRRILRNRGRYEYNNNSYCHGMVNTLAHDCIGTGPRLLMLGNEQIHKAIEVDFAQWMKEVKYANKLRTMRNSKAFDGESYILKTNNKKLNNDVKLYPQLIETDLVSSHYSQKTTVDGIWTDAFGNPEAYNILERRPSDTTSITGKGRRINAKDIIQYANLDRAGQLRGVPELTPALELFAMLRSFTVSVLDSAKTVANHTMILYTDNATEENTDEVDAFYKVAVERNTMKALPYGWKMAQPKAEQPITTYAEFTNSILNEISRTLQIPFNVASGNSSEYNYASGRLDIVNYAKSIDVERSVIDNDINDNIFEDYMKEWLLVNGINNKEIDLRHIWTYDGTDHVDPVKNATAQQIKINNGVTDLATECAKDGKDWEVVLRQRVAERKLQKELESQAGLEEEVQNEEE